MEMKRNIFDSKLVRAPALLLISSFPLVMLYTEIYYLGEIRQYGRVGLVWKVYSGLPLSLYYVWCYSWFIGFLPTFIELLPDHNVVKKCIAGNDLEIKACTYFVTYTIYFSMACFALGYILNIFY